MAEPPTVLMNTETSRFEVMLDGETAFAEYRLHSDQGYITLPHTVVPPAFEGKGVGSALAKAALGYAREHGLKVKPLCPFIARYIATHPEWQDLVREGFQRGRAGPARVTAEDPFALALAAYHRGDFATAERGYRALPNHVNAIHNLGVLYYEHGRLGRAEAEFRRLLAARPDYQPSRFSLAILLLAQRRYFEAWPFFEARLAIPNRRSVEARADFPRWAGEPLAGKRIVACAEEGAGDQLMFGRYLSALRAAGAEVTVACDPDDLGPVFAAAGYETCTLTLRESRLPAADVWCPLGSLPLNLGASGPPAAEYLAIPGAAGGGGVGVVARGSPIHPNDARRSLFGEDAERLLALGRDLSPAATGARNFQETAQIVAGLDLVITVDTSVAHLAGAMGKACWVLLPRLAMDWRWNDGAQSDWYPQMRLWRQPADGDWASVLAGVERALAAEGR